MPARMPESRRINRPLALENYPLRLVVEEDRQGPQNGSAWPHLADGVDQELDQNDQHGGTHDPSSKSAGGRDGHGDAAHGEHQGPRVDKGRRKREWIDNKLPYISGRMEVDPPE